MSLLSSYTYSPSEEFIKETEARTESEKIEYALGIVSSEFDFSIEKSFIGGVYARATKQDVSINMEICIMGEKCPTEIGQLTIARTYNYRLGVVLAKAFSEYINQSEESTIVFSEMYPKVLKTLRNKVIERRNKMIKITQNFSSETDAVIYNGSCYEFVKQIPSKSVKLVITSPPYNIGKEYEEKTDLKQYYQKQEEIIHECIRTLSEDGSICWQVGNYVDGGEIFPLDILLFPIFIKHKLKLRNRIIWHFGHGLHASKRFSGRYETILWFTKSDSYTFNLDAVRVPQKYPNKKYFKGSKRGELSCNPLGKNPSDVWEIPNVKSNHVEKTIHPCQFPIELVERLVLSLTNENDYVFDPFLGVGSTTAAAVKNKRKGIGSEIIKEYYSIAIERTNAAYDGVLKARPMNKPIYNPEFPKENLNFEKEMRNQQTLFEGKLKFEALNENY